MQLLVCQLAAFRPICGAKRPLPSPEAERGGASRRVLFIGSQTFLESITGNSHVNRSWCRFGFG